MPGICRTTGVGLPETPGHWLEVLLLVFAVVRVAYPEETTSTEDVLSTTPQPEVTESLSPQHVTIEARAEHSFTLCWDPPDISVNSSSKLVAYSLSYIPSHRSDTDEEKELLLSNTTTSILVPGLKEGTTYDVTVAAVYEDYKRSPSPTLTIHTLVPTVDFAISADMYPDGDMECNCSDPGMLACTRTVANIECTCFPPYTGRWCEQCSPGYFRASKECQFCPCSNVTSTGECTLDNSRRVVCVSCLPGHLGPKCTTCAEGYQWREDRCLSVHCLDVCMDKDSQICLDCEGIGKPISAPTAQRSNKSRTIADGSVPLVAVLVTLGILLTVSAMATCYRYWSQRRMRPRLPFWSIELREDKMNLSSECHYQHLDAATSRVVQAQNDDTDGDRPHSSPSSPARSFHTLNL